MVVYTRESIKMILLRHENVTISPRTADLLVLQSHLNLSLSKMTGYESASPPTGSGGEGRGGDKLPTGAVLHCNAMLSKSRITRD